MSEPEKVHNKNLEKVDVANFDKKVNDVSLLIFSLVVVIFIIFVIFSFFSNEKPDCVPIYSQEPTQEQINAIENSRKADVYGDNYLLSKKIGCE